MRNLILIASFLMLTPTLFAQDVIGGGGGGGTAHIVKSARLNFDTNIDRKIHSHDIKNLREALVNSTKGAKEVIVDKNEVEAFISKDGTYARPIDIEEGFTSFTGVNFIQNNKIELNELNGPDGIQKVLLQNGKFICLSSCF